MTNRPNDNRYLALDEYIRLGEPDQADRSHAWKTAIGLQDVDGLRTSDYLLETAKETGTNRYLHVDYGITGSKSARQSALKCQNGTLNVTLEELALLRIMKEKPSVTQKELAEKTGKSERTIKRMTIAMQEKKLIERIGGRRNGRWIVSAEITKEE